MERVAIEGNSPVIENIFILLVILLEYYGKRKPCRNPAELSAKAKYYDISDSEPVP